MLYRRLALFALLGAVAPTALAQDLSIKEILSGKLPLTMKLAEVPADYQAVTIKTSGGGGLFDMSNMGLFALMGMGAGSQAPTQAKMMAALSVVWTKGDTILLSGKEFLVTYRMGVSSTATTPDPATLPLRLTLIRTDAIQELSPAPEVTAASLLQASPPAEIVGGEAAAIDSAAVDTAASPTSEPTTPIASTDERMSSLKARALSNAKQITLATLIQASDHDDTLANVQSTPLLRNKIRPYVKDEAIFVHPNPRGGLIKYNILLAGKKLSAIPDVSKQLLFVETEDWPDGTRIVAFADGSVKFVDATEYATLIARSPVK